MTTPDERLNSIIRARDFIRSLIDPKQTPKVPANIRKEASHRLRHFPSEFYLEQLRQSCPDILGEESIRIKEI